MFALDVPDHAVSYARREYQVYVLVTPSLAFSLRDGAF